MELKGSLKFRRWATPKTPLITYDSIYTPFTPSSQSVMIRQPCPTFTLFPFLICVNFITSFFSVSGTIRGGSLLGKFSRSYPQHRNLHTFCLLLRYRRSPTPLLFHPLYLPSLISSSFIPSSPHPPLFHPFIIHSFSKPLNT